MFRKNKIEAISFKEFMANERNAKEMPRINSIYAFSAFFPAITPKSFFPVHDTDFLLFLVGVGAIAGSAFLQHITARAGSTLIADVLFSISGFVFPIVVYGAIFWFFFTL
jgi:uncharacterized transporter YbjL